jgi:DNA gyrase subunit B
MILAERMDSNLPLSFQLQDLEPVRKRPGMYIGNPDERGMETCLFEVLTPAILDFIEGFGDRINITLSEEGSVTIEDFGRGLEIETDPRFGKPIGELRLAALFYECRAFTQNKLSRIGLNGVGRCCVNALSEWMRVDIRRESAMYSMVFERGKLVEPLKESVGERSILNGGLSIKFKPDPGIFRNVSFDLYSLVRRLDHTACLNKGLFIQFRDDRPANKQGRQLISFFYPKGLSDFVCRHASLPANEKAWPIEFSKIQGEIIIEAAIQFDSTDDRRILSFLNQSQTRTGGTHVEGFVLGLREVLVDHAKRAGGWTRKDFRVGNLQKGITAILAVSHPAPRYNSSTTDNCCNEELVELCRRATFAGVSEHFAKNPEALKRALWHMSRTS